MGRLPPLTVTTVIDSAGRPLVPLDPVVRLTGLAVESARSDSVRSLPAVGSAGTATLDLVTGELRRGSVSTPIARADVLWVAGELFIATDRLAELLGAEVHVDWGLLSIAVLRSPPFPAEQQREIESRRAAARDRQTSTRLGSRAVVPYEGGSGGTVVDWSVASATPDPASASSAQARIGLAVAGGDLALGLAHTTAALPDEGRWQESWTYRRAFPGWALMHQLHAGDLYAGGATLQAIRGIYVTNAPIVRDAVFSEIPIAPDVPRGWEYEIYQNGQLLGFSDGTGGGPVNVPLRYGSTPLTVRMLSPSGEEVVSQVLYQVPPNQLPRGRLEYGLGGGRCRLATCDRFGFAKLDYGVRSWLTIGAGVETPPDSAHDMARPFGSISLASLGGWQAQLHHAQDLFSRMTLGYLGRGPNQATLNAGVTSPGIGQPSFLGTDDDDRWYVDGILTRRLGNGPLHTGRLEARTEGRSGSGSDRWRSSVIGDLRRGSVGLHYEHDRTSPGGFALISALAVIPSGAPPVVANAAITTWLGADRSGIQLLEVTTSQRIATHTSLNLTGRTDRRSAGSMLSIALTTSLGFGRATARAISASGRGSGGMAVVTGVTTYDRNWGFRAMEYGGIGSGGVGGLVFYDQDGDGSYGAPDSLASQTTVLIAGRREVTDSSGRFAVWNVLPYEIIEVAVDTLRTLAPDWIPATPGTLIRAAPHRYNRVDVPLVRTREIAGRIIAGRGVWTAGGISLSIRDVATGATVPAMTFTDGEFYVSRLRPGTYDLTVAPAALEALDAHASPASVRFSIPLSGDVRVVDVDSIVLVSDSHVEPETSPVELPAPADPDDDGDGVADRGDACRSTPRGTLVDDLGCPTLFSPDRGTVELQGVTFETGTATLAVPSLTVLARVAETLRARADLRIEVAGHTDSTGSRSLNLRLSLARAEAVRGLLIAQGVPAERLTARGYGPDQPVATNATTAGRAQNRRSELRRIAVDSGATGPRFTIELTGIGSIDVAKRLHSRLVSQGFDARLDTSNEVPRLLVGRFIARRDAELLTERLIAGGLPARVVPDAGR